jgi:uncharacterized protein YjbI with pentapeptide repeats/peptidoglycan hydrolase-like protein with peptidoglycan-binding domain
MARQAKRGRLAPLATCRLPIDALDALPESATPQVEAPAECVPGQAPGDYADLSGANLAKADMCGVRLRFAVLSAANLEAADLSRADLRLALFNRANLGGANLSSAMLDHASFAGASLAKAKLCGASLRFASFEGSRLKGADLSGADLRHTRLDRADFTTANFSSAQLDYADFSGANLADADLSGAHLRYAKNLTRAQLDQGRVSADTILPLYFEDSQCYPWSSDRNRAPGGRMAWIAGAVLAALASLSLVSPLFNPNEAVTRQAQSGAAAAQAAVSKVVLPSATAAGILSVGAKDVSLVAPRATDFDLLRPKASGPARATATSRAWSAVAMALPAPMTLSAVLTGPDSALSSKTLTYRFVMGPRHPSVLTDVSPPILRAVKATQTVAVRELQIEELSREFSGVPVGAPIGSFPGFEPLTLVVSLRQQKLDVYRGTDLVTSSKVSSGKRGHDTRAGVFSILEKQRRHHSNLYSNAPMPWMQRLTWSGTALHGGVVPGYPASHGCIRLPFSFAPKLFDMTTVGANVVVAGDRVTPKPIEHENLFQPIPIPAEASLVFAEPNLVAPGLLSAAAAAERPDPAEGDAAVSPDVSSDAPLRILVTLRTDRDQVITMQYLLAGLGYLTPQDFSGRVGPETVAAIKAFQKATGLPETGSFSDELAKRVNKVAGKAEPPLGHLFVRQNLRPVLDVPIGLLKPEQPLGTHLFTMGLAPGSAKSTWMAISLEGDDSASVLDRIEIPDHVRRIISARLTPGSTLIVADTSVNSAILPDGDDFLVLAKATPATAAVEPRQGAKKETAKAKRAKAPDAVAKRRAPATREREAKRIYRVPDPYGGFRLFRRW